jgi:GT2 family glycosyltransferase
MNFHEPLVSILIINYNGALWLPACLRSVAAISYPNYEVIVVDNGSTDDSLHILAEFPKVKLICSQFNLGFAGGNNLGIRHCSGEYVLLLNNDTIVVPNFLEPLCDYLNRNPKVGIVQGKMTLPRQGNALDVCGSFLTALGFPYHYGYYKPDGPKYQRSYPVFSSKGACLLFRSELIAHTGNFLFDEDFFCYYEESDFCHRAWLAGFEVHFVAGPPIQHLMGATAGGAQADFVLRHYLRNMTFSLLSNLSLSSRLRILPFFFVMLVASMLAATAKLNGARCAAHWGAITHCIASYDKILARRRLIKSLRRQSDRAIFAKVLKTPRLDYFIKTLTGNLKNYLDEDLP